MEGAGLGSVLGREVACPFEMHSSPRGLGVYPPYASDGSSAPLLLAQPAVVRRSTTPRAQRNGSRAHPEFGPPLHAAAGAPERVIGTPVPRLVRADEAQPRPAPRLRG